MSKRAQKARQSSLEQTLHETMKAAERGEECPDPYRSSPHAVTIMDGEPAPAGEPTARPWKVYPGTSGDRIKALIVPDGDYAAVAYCERPEDARLIARAANSHDALTAALFGCEDLLREMQEDGIGTPWEKAIKRKREAALSALAAAKGEG